MTVGGANTVRVADVFSDPDGDPLSYAAVSSDPAVATASIDGTDVLVAAIAKGSATVTVTASDGEAEARLSFAVLVNDPTSTNQPPAVSRQLQDLSIPRGDSRSVNLAGTFTDADGDALSYTATSSNTHVAAVTAFGETLQISALSLGTSEIAVRASDGRATAQQRFHVTVPEGAPVLSMQRIYVMQQNQDPGNPIPLVAGREASLWVSLLADQPNLPLPTVVVVLYRNGAEVTRITAHFSGLQRRLPTKIQPPFRSEHYWIIDAQYVEPGVSFAVEVDPGDLTVGSSSQLRYPGSGSQKFDVVAMPPLDLTLIPFVYSDSTEKDVIADVEAMAAAPWHNEFMAHTRMTLPIGVMHVKAHDPVVSSIDEVVQMANYTLVIRLIEEGTGYYMGLRRTLAGGGGVADLAGYVSVSQLSSRTIAHELGHNFSLRHAPCGNPENTEPNYPHTNGSIGHWGLRPVAWRTGGTGEYEPVNPTRNYDLMSYCRDRWISPFHYNRAMAYRVSQGDAAMDGARSSSASPARTLLLWGGVTPEGDPYLEPALVVDAPPVLPAESGPWEISGWNRDGSAVFALDFAMREIVDADGASVFAFLLEVEDGWAGDLESIRLEGPSGSHTLDVRSDEPLAIVREAATGQVRAFLRGQDALRALGSGPGRAGGDVSFSRGIPAREEWRW